jgi:hypothetical protein
MSKEGRQPPPPFDGKSYERPQQDWVCGHSCEGSPCRLGPSASGRCRSGPDCKPILVTQEGQTKGMWKCTRPPSWGGPCADGPLPDGTCCKSTPPCVPVRSLRARRGLTVVGVLALSLGALLIGLSKPWRDDFISPGRLTHSRRALSEKGCAGCHAAANRGPADWVDLAYALGTGRGALAPAQLISQKPRDRAPMDLECQKCHGTHSFHQTSILNETPSCSVCHMEHQGNPDLKNVDPAHCTLCHGNAAQMKIAAERAKELSPVHFKEVLAPGKKAFPVARPPEGLTAQITSFADHPEFRAKLPGVTDNSSISFSHFLHLNDPSIPTVNGAKLRCDSCHVPENSGRLMQPVTFARHCQSCHSVLIDPAFPDQKIPHGSVEGARSFIRRFVTTYTENAQLRDNLNAFRQRERSGESLERKIFFGEPSQPPGGSCSLCHVVKKVTGGGAPLIEKSGIPDVWLPRGIFDHSRHTQTPCASCHTAESSRSSTEINLPSKQSCALCHHPNGSTDRCTDCHQYHPGQPQIATWLPTPAEPAGGGAPTRPSNPPPP